ncbi:flavodoxin domain-containing protein [Caenispirillum salinarum]|uniref:flavodoxin domain-containing protein n=1 Tax=Caenispirillum salinarum TaxID=859058 RepID=UPI0038501904
MSSILILVGTESGNAQMVGETLMDEFSAKGHDVDMAMDDATLDGLDLPARDVLLVVTSTHGLGELPDNIIPVHDALADEKPDLSGLKYGVIALGDQTYSDTFCKAGKIMDALLGQLGAHKVGERLEIDACTQPLPDEDALAWGEEWLAQLG